MPTTKAQRDELRKQLAAARAAGRTDEAASLERRLVEDCEDKFLRDQLRQTIGTQQEAQRALAAAEGQEQQLRQMAVAWDPPTK